MSQLTSIQSTLHQQFPLIPPLLNNAMDLFCQTHVFYSSFTHANDFYDNDRENQLEKIFLAAGIQFIGNQFKIVDKSVTVLMITKCALDIMYAYRDLSEKWIDLKNIIQITLPFIYYASSSDFERKEHNSIPFFEMVKIAIISRIYRIKVIAVSLFKLLCQLFITSMCLRDIYLVYHQDEHKRFEVLVALISKHTKYTALFNQQLAEFGDEIDDLVVLTSSFLNVFKLNIDKNEVQVILFNLRSKAKEGVQMMIEEGENSLKSIIDPNVLKAPSVEFMNPNAFVNFLSDDSLPSTPEFSGKKVVGISVTCIKDVEVKKVEKTKETVTLTAKVFKYFKV
ncbi:MAG: hypothetical protein Q8K60_00445 [Parachlamydiaceae bacterium]|nr:hypothetical protein [Parachlamydiaceae bacterium]